MKKLIITIALALIISNINAQPRCHQDVPKPILEQFSENGNYNGIITIDIPVAPGDITGKKTVCSGEADVEYSISPVTDATSYKWTVPPQARITNGQGTTSIRVSFKSTSGEICVSARNKKGKSAESCIAIKVNLKPTASAGIDVSICNGLTTKLEASGGKSYSWTPSTGLSNTDIFNPVASPTSTTVYKVTVSNNNNCGTATDEIKVTVVDFTPFKKCGNNLIYEGRAYKTVKIGEQCWMAENLNVGTMIRGNLIQADNGKIEKYCYNNNEVICETDGGLYQWNEVMRFGAREISDICPCGWHVPTDDEWKILEKEIGISQMHINISGYRGTNQGTQLQKGGTTGFNAIPAGYRKMGGYFYDRGTHMTFWSSTEHNLSNAWKRLVGTEYKTIDRSHAIKKYGYSVRCLKD